jgi:hypothetical protein
MSPWFGGITPLAIRAREDEDFPGKLYQEELVGQCVAHADTRGLLWQGLRVGGALNREQLVGLRLELDYLTLGHSNVLKFVYRVHNTTTAVRKLWGGLLAFWQPDGESGANVLRSRDIERKHTEWESWSHAGHWGMVSNPRTGRTGLLVSPYSDVRLVDWGQAGGQLSWFCAVNVPPCESIERVCYAVLCECPSHAMRYRWLKHYP